MDLLKVDLLKVEAVEPAHLRGLLLKVEQVADYQGNLFPFLALVPLLMDLAQKDH